MTPLLLSLALAATEPAPINGVDKPVETERSMMFEFKLGPMLPLIDRDFTGTGPYAQTFGGKGSHLWLLLGEVEFERQILQSFGTLSAGVSAGYGEKYAHTTDPTGATTSDTTALKIVPLKLLAAYRWDWLAQNYNIPLVPYLKAGFVVEPWWVTKGSGTALVDNVPGQGINFGVMGAAGISLMLDFLDQRLARDFDTGVGVNHTYLFAEFSIEEVKTDFKSTTPLDLSSRHWMFGVSLEF